MDADEGPGRAWQTLQRAVSIRSSRQPANQEADMSLLKGLLNCEKGKVAMYASRLAALQRRYDTDVAALQAEIHALRAQASDLVNDAEVAAETLFLQNKALQCRVSHAPAPPRGGDEHHVEWGQCDDPVCSARRRELERRVDQVEYFLVSEKAKNKELRTMVKQPIQTADVGCQAGLIEVADLEGMLANDATPDTDWSGSAWSCFEGSETPGNTEESTLRMELERREQELQRLAEAARLLDATAISAMRLSRRIPKAEWDSKVAQMEKAIMQKYLRSIPRLDAEVQVGETQWTYTSSPALVTFPSYVNDSLSFASIEQTHLGSGTDWGCDLFTRGESASRQHLQSRWMEGLYDTACSFWKVKKGKSAGGSVSRRVKDAGSQTVSAAAASGSNFKSDSSLRGKHSSLPGSPAPLAMESFGVAMAMARRGFVPLPSRRSRIGSTVEKLVTNEAETPTTDRMFPDGAPRRSAFERGEKAEETPLIDRLGDTPVTDRRSKSAFEQRHSSDSDASEFRQRTRRSRADTPTGEHMHSPLVDQLSPVRHEPGAAAGSPPQQTSPDLNSASTRSSAFVTPSRTESTEHTPRIEFPQIPMRLPGSRRRHPGTAGPGGLLPTIQEQQAGTQGHRRAVTETPITEPLRARTGPMQTGLLDASQVTHRNSDAGQGGTQRAFARAALKSSEGLRGSVRRDTRHDPAPPPRGAGDRAPRRSVM
eukprot:TRINITY_DN22286_c0_g2_i1.p1 TRINITY_DN22286_c0_g2~~TRINITY_DN22286_c0_g2_i1.p1  ORF type:complete len:727 (+),score=87.05 TRINITY_DN22286_c0_g2_i1:55-2181(+)